MVKEKVNIYEDNSLITSKEESKITFTYEWKLGHLIVPIKTELDLSNIPESQHDKILNIAKLNLF
ncbi:MAG: hypothetical protein ACOC1O_00735 [bacterium]